MLTDPGGIIGIGVELFAQLAAFADAVRRVLVLRFGFVLQPAVDLDAAQYVQRVLIAAP